MDKPLTQNIRPGSEPVFLAEYEQAGGYEALRKVLKEMSPQQVQDEVTNSDLRGRGGAGFPTGKKWSFLPMGEDAPHPKYLVINADEMEPGTFKDRYLMEGDPHQMIESSIVSAYALEADAIYIFLRWEYRNCANILEKAIGEAYEKGYLGQNILESGYNVELYLHISAGRYMCGEETGLLNALEGRAARPRAKPPYPQLSGLFGKPTLVNNVETICSVHHIAVRGAEWFKNLSRTEDGGTKIYGASGRVKHPGVWELPMGTTLGEILEEHAGGMLEEHRFRGALPGGASTDFLIEDHFDVPMDFTHVMQAGSRLGTGTVVVLDDKTCPVGFVHNLQRFFAHESCGWCTPCREGLPWGEKILLALENGEGQKEDLQRLETLTRFLGMGYTFCALAPGAMEPLQSALKYFRDDFVKHIDDKKCPWK